MIASIAVISRTTIRQEGWSTSRLPRQWFLSLAASSHSMSDSPSLQDVDLFFFFFFCSTYIFAKGYEQTESSEAFWFARASPCLQTLVNSSSWVVHSLLALNIVNFSDVPLNPPHLFACSMNSSRESQKSMLPTPCQTPFKAPISQSGFQLSIGSVPASSPAVLVTSHLGQCTLTLYPPFSPQWPEKDFKNAVLDIHSCLEFPGQSLGVALRLVLHMCFRLALNS